jgi:large conductance mechanosensitive channel
VPGVLKEFKDFIARGNVVDLAVAVVIGAAFSTVVAAVVAGLITPLIGMIGGTEFKSIDFTINKSTFEVGTVINALIYFLVVAAVVFFFVIKPLNILEARRKRGEELVEPESLSDEAMLLSEIRDLLAGQVGRPDGQGPLAPSDTPPPPPGPGQSF